jgi:hypothetical protein
MGDGLVYVLSNPSMPGLVKIGRTERDVQQRVAELSAASGVPAAFVLEAAYPAIDSGAAEAAVHVRLAQFRLPGREFFRVAVEEASRTVAKVCGLPPYFLSANTGQETRLFEYGCRECGHHWVASAFPPRCPNCAWKVVDRLRRL